MSDLTKKELIEKIQNLNFNQHNNFFNLKGDLLFNNKYYNNIKEDLNFKNTKKDILFHIEELLDEKYIIDIMSSVERGDWQDDYEGFRDSCYIGIEDIEAFIKLLPKKNQQKYLQKVETLWSLYNDMVEEAERCIAEETEEEEEEEEEEED